MSDEGDPESARARAELGRERAERGRVDAQMGAARARRPNASGPSCFA